MLFMASFKKFCLILFYVNECACTCEGLNGALKQLGQSVRYLELELERITRNRVHAGN